MPGFTPGPKSPGQEGQNSGPNFDLALQNIKESARLIWDKPLHIHYTDHGIRHSEAIISRLSEVLESQPKELSPLDWFLLKAAAYLHDVGMQCTDKALLREVAGFPANFEFPLTPALLEKIRKVHNQLSYRMIMDADTDEGKERYPLLHRAVTGLPDEIDAEAIIEALAVLCKGHKGDMNGRKGDMKGYKDDDDMDDQRLDSLGNAIPNPDGPPVNLRLLCTLLRFGDTLDADSSRVRMARFQEMSNLLPPERKIHIWKHWFVSNVVIKDGLVELHYKIPELYKGLADPIMKLAEEPLINHKQDLLKLWQKEGIHIEIISIKPQIYLKKCKYTMSEDTLDYLKNGGKQTRGRTQTGVSLTRETQTRETQTRENQVRENQARGNENRENKTRAGKASDANISSKDLHPLSEEVSKALKYLDKVEKAFEINGYKTISKISSRAASTLTDSLSPQPGCNPQEAEITPIPYDKGKIFYGHLFIQRENEMRRIIVFPFITSREDIDRIHRELKNLESMFDIIPGAIPGVFPVTLIIEGVQEEGVWGHAGQLGIILTPYSSLIKGLLNFREYVRGLIDDWLIDNYTRASDKINKMYVAQDAYFYGQDRSQAQNAEALIADWLQNPALRHLTILGDFGTGKTVLTGRLAYTYGQAYLDNQDKNLIPVRINLKNVNKNFSSVRELIIDYFTKVPGFSYEDDTGYERFYAAFQLLMEEGLILLIYDSFDEMALETRDIKERFQAINTLASDKAKIILTSRTHYFLGQEHEQAVHKMSMGKDLTTLGESVLGNSQFRIAYLPLFDEPKIRQYLHNANLDEEKVYQQIKGTYDLGNLAERPLFLQMIKETLPRLQRARDVGHNQPINVGLLYKEYIDTWLGNPSYYKELTPEQKCTFSKKLALELWNSGQKKVHYSKLYYHVAQAHPGLKYDLARLQGGMDTVRDSSFLIRDNDGNYQFSHRSFLEAFLAWEILDRIEAGGTETEGADTEVFNTSPFSREVLYFLYYFSQETGEGKRETGGDVQRPGEWKQEPGEKVITACRTILNGPYRRKVTENAFQTLYWMRRYHVTRTKQSGKTQQTSLSDLADLSDLAKIFKGERERLRMDLSSAKLSFPNADFSYFPFSACISSDIFNKKKMEGTDLEGAVLDYADFSGLSLKGVNLKGARIKKGNFQQTILQRCVLDYARLNDADCKQARFEESKLWAVSFFRADLEGTQFSHCDLGRALFYKAKITDSARIQEEASGNSMFGTSWGIGQEDLRVVPLSGHSDSVYSVAFSPDGQILASASSDKTIILWDSRTGQKIKILEGHRYSVTSVAFSPDGQILASASSDKTIILWDSRTGQRSEERRVGKEC